MAVPSDGLDPWRRRRRLIGGEQMEPSDQSIAIAKVVTPEQAATSKTSKAERGDLGTLSCSFCGKTQGQVAKLFAGSGVYICDECIIACAEALAEQAPGTPPEPRL